MVTLHHVITVYNDMSDHMDGIMQALARKKTKWKERCVLRHEVITTEAVQILC